MNQPGNVLSDIQSREGTDNLGCLIGDRVEPVDYDIILMEFSSSVLTEGRG